MGIINWIKNKFRRKKPDIFMGIDPAIGFEHGGGIIKSHKEGDITVIDDIELFEFSITDSTNLDIKHKPDFRADWNIAKKLEDEE